MIIHHNQLDKSSLYDTISNLEATAVSIRREMLTLWRRVLLVKMSMRFVTTSTEEIFHHVKYYIHSDVCILLYLQPYGVV